MDVRLDIAHEFVVHVPHRKAFGRVFKRAEQLWPFRRDPDDRVILSLDIYDPHLLHRDRTLKYGRVVELGSHMVVVHGPMGLTGLVVSEWSVTFTEVGPAETLVRMTHRAAGEVSDEEVARYTSGWASLASALSASFQ